MTYTIYHVKRNKLPDKKADAECEKALEFFGRECKRKIKEWKQKS